MGQQLPLSARDMRFLLLLGKQGRTAGWQLREQLGLTKNQFGLVREKLLTRGLIDQIGNDRYHYSYDLSYVARANIQQLEIAAPTEIRQLANPMEQQ